MNRSRTQKSKRTMGVRAHAALALAPVLNQRGALTSDVPDGVAPRDQGLYRALCFGVCRALPQLEAVAARLLKSPFKQRDQDLHALLLIGLYQLYHMRIPTHAAVGETAGGARELNKEWATRVINGCLRRADRERETLLAEVEKTPAVAHWHPQWLLDRLEKAWPEQWQDITAANNVLGPMTLRVNRRQHSREHALAELGDGARPGDLSPWSLYLSPPRPVSQLPGFDSGGFSVQDEAAQLPVEQLAAPDGGRVLDACAAPGGKTGQILEAFPNARVTALDLSARRLDRVRDALRRIGAEAELVQGDAAEPAAWWDGEPFDAILLDAPCSASGILRRQPDVKWHRRRTDLPPLVDLQARMLDALWPLLRPGGRLVYATCSVLRDENDRQIADFLARTDDAEDRTERPADAAPVAAGWQLLTRDNGPDGFYLACLHKRGAADDNKVTDQRS